MTERAFTTTAEARRGGGVAIPVPFDPSEAWGTRDRHVVTGTVDGKRVRGTVVRTGDRHVLPLGPAWARDCNVAPGSRVDVVLGPEGPQVGALAADLDAALDAEPQARAFFASLATFYRKGWVRWVEEAKRPDTRARRISQTVEALKAGRKER